VRYAQPPAVANISGPRLLGERMRHKSKPTIRRNGMGAHFAKGARFASTGPFAGVSSTTVEGFLCEPEGRD
jgi:hypothetical protein